ncbi:MAG: high light inducible protein [Bacteroidetes bacterium GWA2_32_17]|nr:MAG: high light inducible protein [Bacteroidetes bacterium GWA2_32_17]
MKLIEKEFFIPYDANSSTSLIDYIAAKVKEELSPSEIPVRFVITNTNDAGYLCELGVLINIDNIENQNERSIFSFKKREHENTEKFNVVLLIPTGIGAEIGGHCGDGNVVARLIASACDILITHPNVVNASDINEMTENTLYVEGSIITRLLMGQIGLQKSRSNRILMLMDKHKDKLFNDEIVNAVSSARISLGIDCDVYEMDNIINSESMYSKSGRAIGKIEKLEYLFEIIDKYYEKYDAIGLSTFINVPEYYHKNYFSNDDLINPWGGIEAMLTHSVAEKYNIPCAHSPMMASREIMELEVGIVDPRKAPESASLTYLHCILKGLHKSPRITSPDKGINIEDISCLIIPYGCIGLPTLSALENGIPVIAVKENRNRMENKLEEFPFKHNKLFIVENYLEAVGVINAIKSGVNIDTIKRPIAYTNIINAKDDGYRVYTSEIISKNQRY